MKNLYDEALELAKRLSLVSNPSPEVVAMMIMAFAIANDAELERLKLEIERLKSGKFTPEEFQNLCHEDKPVTAKEFAQGCCEYQRKLFGYSHSERERAKLMLQMQEEFESKLEAEKAKVKRFFSKLSSISLRFDACQGDLEALIDDEWS